LRVFNKKQRKSITLVRFPVGAVVKFLYAFVVGFVAVSMIYIVDRFEPNRLLARTLTAIVYLAGALVILAKLG
jgi:hypothetical protein